VPQSPDRLKDAIRVLAPLVAVVALALGVRAFADRADVNVRSYFGTFFPQQSATLAELPGWKLLLPLESFDGRWGTTGFLLVYWLENRLGEPNTFYLLTAVMVAAGYLFTWLTFRSLTFAIFVGVALATTTFNYHVYSVPGSVIILPLVTFLFLFAWCQIQWVRSTQHSLLWGVATLIACLLFALCYEGWLDLVPLAWIVLPVLAWHFHRLRDSTRRARCVVLLCLITGVAVVYSGIKIRMGLGGLHPRGGEADLIFTYGRGHVLLMGEDVLSSYITFFFTTIITYVPPELFSYSLSSWLYGPEKIVALQEGYHAPATHLTHYNHLFLWRYYAGFLLAVFLLIYCNVIKKFIRQGDTHHLILFVLLSWTLVGSPTHLIIKWRPMHAAPFLGYQCYLSVIGWTLLIGYVASRWCAARGGKRAWALGLLLVLNFGWCAYARPALLTHMSRESFLGTYPDPRANLPH